jgi:hypothetical protein
MNLANVTDAVVDDEVAALCILKAEIPTVCNRNVCFLRNDLKVYGVVTLSATNVCWSWSWCRCNGGRC